MDLQLQGKLALVTGSTLGIGRAIARRLHEEGTRTIINGRNKARVGETMAELKVGNPRGEVIGIAADLASPDGMARLIDQVNRHGELDILVNNLGIFEIKPFLEISDADWLRMFDVNVMSGVRLTRAFFPGMLTRDWGRILFLSSESGVKVNSGMIHYSATKTAQMSIARGLAELTKGTAVTVNSIVAGPTRTEGADAFFDKLAAENQTDPDSIIAGYFRTEGVTSIVQRLARPEEIADVAAFLCSPRASYINGTAQRVEGGIVRSLL
jgi:NAD(P)-dependent dehydrogenase (short-subunit alcohol dehydrogenase family)